MVRVFKVSPNVQKLMIDYYKDYKRDKTPPYAIFQADSADVVITLYSSGKAMFQGISADIEAQLWIDQEKHLNNNIITFDDKKKEKKKTNDSKGFMFIDSIGSDEVGTGDYFGPIVVSATYVKKEDITYLESIGVRDSKKLSDDRIKEIAPKIVQRIEYVTFILNNEDYNKLNNNDLNMNKIKAVLHNKVIISLIKKYNPKYNKIVIDQFCSPQKFYEYISDSKEKITNVSFMTKAEDQVISVACASIISRYIFLKEINNISSELKTNIILGASSKVDDLVVNLLNNNKDLDIKKYVKYNFKNTEKIKDNLK